MKTITGKLKKITDKISITFTRFLYWRGFPWLMAGLIATALLLRLAFLFVEYPSLSDDPASYFCNAKSLIDTGTLDESAWWGRDYIVRFPYVYNYIWLLSISMRLFGAGAGAVLFLNTLFSALSSLFLYLLLNSALKNRKIGLLAASLWFLSPVEIAYSILPLPIIIVNSALLGALLVSFHLLKNHTNKKFWIYIILLGLVLGMANLFRPIMSVLVIALALVLAFLLIRKFSFRLLIKFAGAIIAICIITVVINKISLLPPQRVTGHSDLRNSSSWSLFLGSNRLTSGRYNEEDASAQWEVMKEVKGDLGEYDKKLGALTIERYRSFSPIDFISHWWNKATILLAGPRGSIYYELRNFPAVIRMFYNILSFIFYPILLSLLFFLGLSRFIHAKKLPPTVLLMLLTLCGFFASHILLTEVMDRYFVPLIPLMFIIGIWGSFLTPVSPEREKRKWDFSGM